MKVNFNQFFVDCFGTPVVEKGNDTPAKVGEKVALYLYNASAGLTPEEKFTAYKLSNRIAAATEAVDISIEEATLVKKVCSGSLIAGAYGQIVDIIENGK